MKENSSSDNCKINVSIIMAVKNEELHIKEALESILQQKNVNIEIIVINDHSTDFTEKIIRSISSTDNRISSFLNIGKGKCSAFNFGISIAKGDFICLFAGDDIMPQGSLYNRAIKIFNHVNQIDTPVICTSKIKIHNPEGKLHNLVLPRNKNIGSEIGGALMFNRKALEHMFPIPSHLPNEDTWMKLVFNHTPGFEILHSTEIGCIWRYHPGNTSGYGNTYEIYSQKYADRMQALPLFLKKNRDILTYPSINQLENIIRCEKSRASKSFFGILLSRAPVDEILRAVFLYSNKLYNIKKTLYALLNKM